MQTLNMLKTSTGLDLEALVKKSVGKAASAVESDGDGHASNSHSRSLE